MRQFFKLTFNLLGLFQSTHPVWDATGSLKEMIGRCSGFNPRTPCGMRLVTREVEAVTIWFQSTHPVWDATPTGDIPLHFDAVSIHAPRVGCDG